MAVVDGLKDGAFLMGLGVLAWVIVKPINLSFFGQQDYYPNGANNKDFNPDKVIGLGSDNIEVKAIKKLLNKYCYTITESNGIGCCQPYQNTINNNPGGYYLNNDLLDENDSYFSDTDQTVLFNRTGASALSYRTLVNAIKGIDENGNQIAPNNWKNFLKNC